MTLVLEIRDRFKCYGELLIHFLLCLLVTNILLFSHHPPPCPPLLSKVRPSHISLRFLWRSTSSPVSPDEEERSGASGCCKCSSREQSRSFVRPAAQPWSSCVVLLVANLRWSTVHTEHQAEILLLRIMNGQETGRSGTSPALQQDQSRRGDSYW